VAQYARGDQVVDRRSGEVGVVLKVGPAWVAVNGTAPRLRGDALRAVRHRGSHLQIIASAGSGKTEVVAQRVADLFASGVEPSALVAFTFTERAAEALKSRIELRVAERLGPAFLDRINGCFVGTIHAYCFRLLQQHVPRYETYDVLDEHRLAAFVTREANRIGIKSLTGRLFSSIQVFLANVDVVDNELLQVDQLEDPFREMVERFHAQLEQYRLLTYGQLIARAIQELDRPEIRTVVHGPLRHLIVDEYQDVNPAQEALIRRLAAAPVELCIVGDDDQSIYQWRGSDVGNIVTFADRYPGVARFEITTNRRSRPAIIAAANRFATTIEGRLPKRMQPAREAAEPEVVLWRASTEADEAELIARSIVELHRRGFRYRDIAVLVRSSASYPKLLAAFERHGIPPAPAGRTGLFTHPDAQRFGRTFAFLADNEWRPEVYGRGARVSLDALVDDYGDGFELDHAGRARIRRRLVAWRREAETPTRPADLVGEFYELLADCGVKAWDLNDPVRVARLGALARCSTILADYESVRRRSRPDPTQPGQAVGGQDRGPWYYRWLAIHIQNWALGAFEGFEGEDEVGLDAVDLTTVHQAKGLEWPVVFVPCVSASRFPSSRTGSRRDWRVPTRHFRPARYEGTVNDERRLFYVATTRARDWLSVSTHDVVNTRAVAPSPFLLQLNGGETPPPARSLVLPTRPPAQASDESLPVLAFSELASFGECGLAYRMRTLLGFEPPLAPELGYGKAVHHIMREVAEHTTRHGRPPTPRQLDRLFDDSFYLPAANKVAHRQLKDAARRLVDRYIQRYGEDLRRVWAVERPFELHLPNAVVIGRADVILDQEGGRPQSLAIVDYKTAADGEHAHDLQLQVYANAGRREGLDVRAAYVHDLKRADRDTVDVSANAVATSERTVVTLVDRLRSKDFSAQPEPLRCGRCDVRPLCRFAATGLSTAGDVRRPRGGRAASA
jgi:ATP-dependent DNA helicase UvrD/PcrA